MENLFLKKQKIYSKSLIGVLIVLFVSLTTTNSQKTNETESNPSTWTSILEFSKTDIEPIINDSKNKRHHQDLDTNTPIYKQVNFNTVNNNILKGYKIEYPIINVKDSQYAYQFMSLYKTTTLKSTTCLRV